MTINYNVQGPKRKELVQLIANFTGCSPKYICSTPWGGSFKKEILTPMGIYCPTADTRQKYSRQICHLGMCTAICIRDTALCPQRV